MSDAFIREVRTVEFTARHAWHLLRPFVKGHLSPRCRRCVLPDSYAPLGADGVCSVCAESSRESRAQSSTETGAVDERASSESDANALAEFLRSYEGRGTGNYDALVLFSGGKDSAYMLHRLRREHPRLRLLSVLVDNGFMSPYALRNATDVLAKLDVDHATLRPQQSFVNKAFRYTLTHLELQEGYSIVDLMDGSITFDAARNLAAEMSIPMVLCGLSRVQVEQVYELDRFELPRAQERDWCPTRAGVQLKDVFSEQEMHYWWDGSRWPEERVPHFVLPFCAWDVSEIFVLQEVERLGLLDARYRSPLLTNNALIPLIGMAEVARFGFSSFEVEFARMVREGKSERNYWLALFEMLEYSTKTGRFVNKTADETLARLGLSRDDIGLPS